MKAGKKKAKKTGKMELESTVASESFFHGPALNLINCFLKAGSLLYSSITTKNILEAFVPR